MKENHVQYQVSGPPYHAASANYVPNSAAWEIRKNGFVVGMIFGIVIALAVIAFTAKRPPGSAPGTPPTRSQEQEIGGRGRTDNEVVSKNTGPNFGVPSLGPNEPGKYAYAIGHDAYLQVHHDDGALYPSGTIKDGKFMLTKRRPAEALSLPQDIDESWSSSSIFSAKLRKPTPFQRRDASWWSESRGEYIAWDSRDAKLDRFVFDAAHGISVPVIILTEAESAVASGEPLKLFDNRLCLFSKSMNAFVPLRCPADERALWNERQSRYLTPEGTTLTASSIYHSNSDNTKPQESN